MSELPLPPDLERLQAIRAWVAQQQKTHDTVGTFLDILAATVDAALAEASPAGPPGAYRIQKMRVPEGRAVLHRADCWITDGTTISREDAHMALADPVTRGQLDMCEACRPEESLEA